MVNFGTLAMVPQTTLIIAIRWKVRKVKVKDNNKVKVIKERKREVKRKKTSTLNKRKLLNGQMELVMKIGNLENLKMFIMRCMDLIGKLNLDHQKRTLTMELKK